MKSFKLKIVTPQGIYKETDIEILNIRTTNGQVGILANHLPFASGLEISNMNFLEKGKREEYAIAGGFIYVGENETTVIANAIESKEEIDLNRAQEAKKRAEERLSSKAKDIDLLRAEIALRKALNRISVKTK